MHYQDLTRWHRTCSTHVWDALVGKVKPADEGKLDFIRGVMATYINGLDNRVPRGAGSGDEAPANVSQGSIKLIPWEEIWISLRVARLRGNVEMIDVFYDTLFREAIFDDKGAWSSQGAK